MECTAHRDNECTCFIIPSHMLDAVAENGDHEQRKWAIKSISISQRLLGRRDVMKAVPFDAPSITGGKHRTVFSADQKEDLPGSMIMTEGAPASTDPAVNEAYDGAGSTYDCLHEKFGRNSIDDKGLRLDSTVHYGNGYDNAFWDGRQMVYGDGDGKLFNRFTLDLATIAHEFVHGMTQKEAKLVYWDQPGALNESFSDVFGSLVKQYKLQQKFADADWIIGAGIFTARIKGVGFRSLKSPGTAYNDKVIGKDPQPAHMKDFKNMTEDNGGVHVNSGIPNRAFYVACELLNDQWKAGKVWYIALRDRLRERSTFQDCAYLTSAVAAEVFGTRSKEQGAVKKAWESVGLKVK